MLHINRKDLAFNLAAYGEAEASKRIENISHDDYKKIAEIGFRHAQSEKNWIEAACLAAVEVLEGVPRELKRKRRKLVDQEEWHRQPDPKFIEIEKRFEKYSRGERVQRKEILQALAVALIPYFNDYRYIKTRSELRRAFDGGECCLRIERGRGSVALRFGVIHTAVEKVKNDLFGGRGFSEPASWTIGMYTLNMGPSSPHWQYPIDPHWPIFGSEGLEVASEEIVDFANDVVVPYLDRHQQPELIRDTLMNLPGKTLPLEEDCTVFSIDCFLENRTWLDEDYERLKKRYGRYVVERQKKLDDNFNVAVSKWSWAT